MMSLFDLVKLFLKAFSLFFQIQPIFQPYLGQVPFVGFANNGR